MEFLLRWIDMDIKPLIEVFSNATHYIEEIFQDRIGEKFFEDAKQDIELECAALNIEKFTLTDCDLGFALVLYQTFDLLNKLPKSESEYDDKLKRSYLAGAFVVAIKNIYYRDHNFNIHEAIVKVFKNNKKGLCTVEREFLKAINYDIPIPRELSMPTEAISPSSSLVFAEVASINSQDTASDDAECLSKS
jgi:hypothetical protein